jgi:hypothetical protein
VKKRIDLGLMWIFSSYLKLKEAQRTKEYISKLKNNLHSSEMRDEDEIVELSGDAAKSEQELLALEEKNVNDLQSCELDYDKTLHAILFSLKDSKDL